MSEACNANVLPQCFPVLAKYQKKLHTPTVENVPAHRLQQLVAAVALFAAEAVQHDVNTVRGDSGRDKVLGYILLHTNIWLVVDHAIKASV